MSRARIPLMAAALIALVVGAWVGLLRIGWDIEPRTTDLPAAHGPLMVAGFLGTVIGLERAVALGTRWGYLGPTLTGLGVAGLIGGPDDRFVPALATGGSLLLIAMSVGVLRRGAGLDTALLVAGAGAWFAGNLLWLAGRPLYQAVPWWGAFLVLTIVGERLDMSRLVRVPTIGAWVFRAAVAAYLAGTALTLVTADAGMRLSGAGMIALALWLLRYDVARRTVRQPGLSRFIALCVLSGAAWLAVSGGLALAFGDVRAGLRYDALLHALFLGFVFALIFGHAPIILPAVTGLALAFRPAFYLHVVLLHGSVLLRVAADLGEDLPLRRWGGMLNAMALLVFLLNTAWAVRAGRRKQRPAAA